jgi:5-methylcytosine-specific restriction enzyme A
MPRSPPVHRRTTVGKVHGQEYDRQRTRELHTGSKRWQAIRRHVLLRDHYTCRECGRYGNEVDHKDGDSSNNDPENLQTLCKTDHARKTASETFSNVSRRSSTR